MIRDEKIRITRESRWLEQMKKSIKSDQDKRNLIGIVIMMKIDHDEI